MTSLSVVIVTYNSENEIRNCLDSILSSFSTLEIQILITDNNSSDSTIDIIENINDKRISLIQNKENAGFTKAINQCLAMAEKEIILILNPDTVIIDDSILTLIEELRGNNSIGIIAPQLRYPNGTIQKSCRRFPRRRDILYESIGLSSIFSRSSEFGYWKMNDFDHLESRFVDQPAGAALLISNALIKEIGFFDERFPMFFSDVDYCRRVKSAGYKIKFNAECAINHVGGASVLRKREKMILSSHISMIKYFQKYSSYPMSFVYNIFIIIYFIILTPVRILINFILPSLKYRKKHTL